MRSSMEARPLFGILPHRCTFFTEIYLYFYSKKLSNLSSFRAIQALIASQSTFEKSVGDTELFIIMGFTQIATFYDCP